jgi:hypothetical protein
MLNRIVMVTLMLGVVFAGMPGMLEAASGSRKSKAGKVEGVLTAKSATGVVIRVQNGSTVSLRVVATTKIEVADVRVPLTRLKVGARTQALFDPATNIASKVEQ